MPSLHGIVLAAGRGRRMGSPKALLVVDGEPLLRAHVRRLVALGCARVIVAMPAEIADQVTAQLSEGEVIAVETASPAETLAAALAWLRPNDADRVIITPVDLRPPRIATLRALLEVDADAVFPRHQGKNGHPLVVRGRVLSPYLDAPTPPRLDVALADVRVPLDVDDAAVVEDFDRPDDLPSR